MNPKYLKLVRSLVASSIKRMDVNKTTDEDNTKAQLDFFLEVIQAIIESNGDSQVIYPLFLANLHHLNVELIPVITQLQKQFSESDDGKQWIASVLSRFGNLIAKFPLGAQAINLELAIKGYELALEISTRAASPDDWAVMQNNLAATYKCRIQGERAENIELAIKGYKLALEVYTRTAFPEQWAMTQYNLANAYSARIRHERANNLELAITGYKLALEVYTRAASPEDWAKTQHNLAFAYNKRIRGERAENIELAITGYKSVLEVYTHAAFPKQWAMTQNNLANAYSSRIQERTENIELAITGYKLALEVYTRTASPEDWAMMQNNLATAYGNRIWGKRSKNIELAIKGYKLALEVYTRTTSPRGWAMTQNNLALAYSERIWGERSKNIELAIKGYKLALEEYTHAASPEQWAMTQNNLALAYEKIDRVLEAIDCYKSALEIRTPKLLPLDCLRSSHNLGNLAFKQGDWQLALEAYDRAITAVETSRNWATSEASRQEILRDAIYIYENAIQAAIKLQRHDLAIGYGERVRSRRLVELMASHDLYDDSTISDDVREYLRRYDEIDRQIRELRQNDNSDSNNSERISLTTHRSRQALDTATAEITALEAEKHRLYEQIRAKDPVLAGQIQIDSIDWERLQALTAPTTAILSFYSTDRDTHIFIIKQGKQPELFTCEGQGYKEFQTWLKQEWQTFDRIDNPNWHTQLPDLLRSVATKLQLDEIVDRHLQGITELAIVPHLSLHQIPFAALPLADCGYLGDRFIIRSIPSCQILEYCHERDPIAGNIYDAIVADAEDNLWGARYEGKEISRIHDIPTTNQLCGKQQATGANYRALLKRIVRLHACHHAKANHADPLQSALCLGDSDITLRDLLLMRHLNLDEVFLACCQTHVGEATITDDIATLSTGFLCMGARSIVSTLWKIDDVAAALLDTFYHEQRREGISRAIALRKAQIRLRELSGKEFELSYRPGFRDYLDRQGQEIDDRITELETLLTTAPAAERQQMQAEIDRLTDDYDRVNALSNPLENYCEQSHPFGAPYYWAAFICQGMG